MVADRRKKSLYFAEELSDEIEAEARRLGVSVSRMVADAWKISKAFARGEGWPEGVLLWATTTPPSQAEPLDDPISGESRPWPAEGETTT